MKSSAGAKMSLALLGLKSEIVAMVGMVDFYFSALGERKSLSGSAMRFYFVHDVISFQFLSCVLFLDGAFADAFIGEMRSVIERPSIVGRLSAPPRSATASSNCSIRWRPTS